MKKFRVVLIYLVIILIVIDIAFHWGDEPDRTPPKGSIYIDLRKNYEYIVFIREGGGDNNSWDIHINQEDLKKIIYLYQIRKDKLMKFVSKETK